MANFRVEACIKNKIKIIKIPGYCSTVTILVCLSLLKSVFCFIVSYAFVYRCVTWWFQV